MLLTNDLNHFTRRSCNRRIVWISNGSHVIKCMPISQIKRQHRTPKFSRRSTHGDKCNRCTFFFFRARSPQFFFRSRSHLIVKTLIATSSPHEFPRRLDKKSCKTTFYSLGTMFMQTVRSTKLHLITHEKRDYRHNKTQLPSV